MNTKDHQITTAQTERTRRVTRTRTETIQDSSSTPLIWDPTQTSAPILALQATLLMSQGWKPTSGLNGTRRFQTALIRTSPPHSLRASWPRLSRSVPGGPTHPLYRSLYRPLYQMYRMWFTPPLATEVTLQPSRVTSPQAALQHQYGTESQLISIR